MNEEHEQCRDRKLELGLGEILGDQQPPDLSERILAATNEPCGLAEASQPATKPRRRHRWLAMAVAASLLLAIAGLSASLLWPEDPTGPGNPVVANLDRSKSMDGKEDPSEEEEEDSELEFSMSLTSDPELAQEEREDLRLALDSSLRTYDRNVRDDAGDSGASGREEYLHDGWRYDPTRPGDTSVVGGQVRIRGLDRTRSDGDYDVSDERNLELAMVDNGIRRGAGNTEFDSRRGEADQRSLTGGMGGSGRRPGGLDGNGLRDHSRGGVQPVDQLDGGEGTARSEHRGGVVLHVSSDKHVEVVADAVDPEVWESLGGEKGRLLKEFEKEMGPGDFLKEVENQQRIQTEVLQAEVERGISDIREEFGTNPEQARQDLELLVKQIERATDVEEETRARIRKQVVEGLGEHGREYHAVAGANRQDTSGRSRRSVEAAGTSLARTDRPKKQPPKKTWRRAKASPNATRLVVGEKDELLPQGVQANVVVDGFRARVLLDWYYYNDRGGRLEGTFKLRLPNDASLYYLAFGTTSFEYRPQADQLASVGFLPAELLRSSGTGAQEILDARRSTWDNVKEARVVPRQKAAYAYGETVRRRVDPALAEWSGAGVFQCRVFPLEAGRLHRIVVGYDVPLTHDGDDLVYRFEVPADLPECAVDLNVSALPGMQAEISPHVRPFTGGGRAYYHFEEPAEEEIVLRLQQPETMLLLGNDDQAGDFFTTQVQPQLPAGKETPGSSHAIFLVDTSLSSRPEKFNTYLDLLAAILESNRDSLQQFAVLFFNIESHWWKEAYVDNTPENVAQLMDHCHSLALEGATDLRRAIGEAAAPSWQQGRAGEAPRADLFLLSDGAATWGDDNIHMMSKSLSEGTAGALFAYKTGQSGTATGVLDHLARESGGAVFSVAGEQEIAAAATAHNKRPWTLLDVTIDGGRDVMVAGRPRTIYPDQRLTVVGRGTPDPAADLVLKVKRGDQLKTVRLPLKHAVRSELAARAYGKVAVGQLEDLMSATEKISTAYARHFRVPGRSCSLLMLDSEADYRRFEIKPEDDALVVSSSVASEVVTRVIDETATKRIDPKAAVLGWLDRLQQTPSFRLSISTATKLAIDKMPASSFEIDVPRIECKARKKSDLPEDFVKAIGAQKLEYDAVAAEAERRQRAHTSADALKALSSLVENSPGDMVLTRDVAFSAMKWGFGGQAYPLLHRVALARPHQPQVYTAMARCLADSGHTDLALIYFEVALAGQWSNRYQEFAKIAKFEYYRTLRGIVAGELETSVPDFAAARLDTLRQEIRDASIDLVVTMEWNTDRTDVDLHVVEPSGDVCWYENTKTKSGGQITEDVTAGFGPEMYTLPNAPAGKYTVKVSYFNSDTNRTSLRTKVYVTVYKHVGTPQEQMRRHVLTLSKAKEMIEVATVGVD